MCCCDSHIRVGAVGEETVALVPAAAVTAGPSGPGVKATVVVSGLEHLEGVKPLRVQNVAGAGGVSVGTSKK